MEYLYHNYCRNCQILTIDALRVFIPTYFTLWLNSERYAVKRRITLRYDATMLHYGKIRRDMVKYDMVNTVKYWRMRIVENRTVSEVLLIILWIIFNTIFIKANHLRCNRSCVINSKYMHFCSKNMILCFDFKKF